ncbi:MAG TPA: peptidylprolyl isomerase [Steroidobacteraceae bacterium]|nr:peptidylprolyl isomerase [Steroidobacteraceae bacterium]
MNASRLALGALGLALLAACSQNPSPPKQDVVATVNGKALTRATFEQYVIGVTDKPLKDLTTEQRDTLLDNMVRAAVVSAEAERSGLVKEPEVAGTLEIQRLLILDRAAAQDHLKDYKPSEEELRAEYDLRVGRMDKQQYQLAHIQVDTSEEAAKLIEQLGKGGNFAALARQYSKDTNSSAEGGVLPWSGPTGMPLSFAAAVKEMKKGDTMRTPVRTDVGWHVIRVVDVRDSVAPPLESVRDQLVQALQEKKFTAWTDSLVAKAKVTKTP